MTRSPADWADDRPRDREKLAAQLDELDATLDELRSELRAERRREPPKPPSLGELLRFTEQYSIPTLIALLEATIQSLELLRRTLRLADPGRAAREEGTAARTRLDRVGSEAGDQLANALGELRTALSATELPEDSESRRLLDDAYGLTGEIEQRLRDAETVVREQRDRERTGDERRGRSDADRSGRERPGRNRGVMIDVTEDGDLGASKEGEGQNDTASNTGDGKDDERTLVDVDAELESIKHELDRPSGDERGDVDADGSVENVDSDESTANVDSDESTANVDSDESTANVDSDSAPERDKKSEDDADDDATDRS